MNDRFKFRVWDKEQNKYLPLVSRGDNLDFWISLDNTGVYLVERDNNRDIAYFNDITENVIVQFCTGLKDNNGKLIYEGDIVRFYSPYGYATFEIKWSEEFATFGYEDNETDFSEFGRLYDDAKYVQVIGNIYENKSLLESEEE